MQTWEKVDKLTSFLKEINSLAVAFSGGVDSTFLLYMAKKYVKGDVIAITSVSEIHKKTEIKQAEIIAKEIGVVHIKVDTKELSVSDFVKNRKDRCYWCKKNMYKKFIELARRRDISLLAHGANLDDMSDYRPGNKAAKELGVIAPLVYAGLRKTEIREALKKLGINIWNKPSSPCLATRIPYGYKITNQKLRMIERAESVLEDMGFTPPLRVRHYGKLAKIEVSEESLKDILKVRKQILASFKEIGFLFVALDIEGFFSGKLNKALR